MDWLDLLAVQGTLHESSPTTVQKHQFFSAQLSLRSSSCETADMVVVQTPPAQEGEGGNPGPGPPITSPVPPGLSQTDSRVISGRRDRSPLTFGVTASGLRPPRPPAAALSTGGCEAPAGRAGLWGLEAAERFVYRWSGLTHIKGEIQRDSGAVRPTAPGQGRSGLGPGSGGGSPPTRKHLAAGTPSAEGCVSGWPTRLADKSH